MKIKDFDFKNKQFKLPENLNPGRDFPAENFRCVDPSYQLNQYMTTWNLHQDEFTILDFSLI